MNKTAIEYDIEKGYRKRTFMDDLENCDCDSCAKLLEILRHTPLCVK